LSDLAPIVAAMTITPDEKDWTWVLRQPCPDCGLDAGTVPQAAITPMLRASGAAFADLLRTQSSVGVRPAPTVWSPLEYACHVRDVFRIFDERLGMMLDTDDPLFPNWDQDETAVELRYAEQAPAAVAEELESAAVRLTARFDAVTEGQWSRPGRRSDGARFTTESLARYLLHDPVHHWWDVTGIRAAPSDE
jgi:hypothetical protein